MVAAERPTVSSWPQATTWPVSVKMPTESYSLPPQHTAQMPYQVDSRQPPAPNCPIAQPVAPNCCFAQPIAPHCPVAQPFELTTADMKDSMASGVAFVQLPVNAQQLACALSSAGHYVSLPRVEPAGRLSGGFPQHELPLMQTQPFRAKLSFAKVLEFSSADQPAVRALPMSAAPPAPLRRLSVRAAPLTTPRRSYATTTHERPLWMASQAR
jgi:hypothetical protein